MDHSTEENVNERKTQDVIRLRVQGSDTTVNTLCDHQLAKGVSLVCPFPALEVDVPVEFGESDTSMFHGIIHRIGVEDDPETGLPRLRLSIRAEDLGRENHQEAGGDQAQSSQKEVLSINSVLPAKESEQLSQPEASLSLDPKTDDESNQTTETIDDFFNEDSIAAEEDKHWVDWEEMPLPEEIAARARAKRKHRLALHATWIGILSVLVATGFILNRAGIIQMNKVTECIAGLSFGRSFNGSAQATTSDTLKKHTAVQFASAKEEPAAQVEQKEKAVVKDKEAPEDSPARVQLTSSDGNAVAKEPTPGPEIEGNEEQASNSESENETEKEGSTNEEDVSADEVVLSLPTKWPVEYTTGYRVRNPNGVVIDVPGGLVRREGWLETGWHHPMVRSVKAVQRESGARFIIYVNGKLPRFMTTPKPGGIALRLYRNENDVKKTDEIASLDMPVAQ